ncbi:hypothetical protein NPS29_09840 [Pseudomonas putida]|jgi:hypothetical protein|uniref:hypothetical protein n=1 Tax=Pseudomonas TaxID=286 RepID=UPI00236425BE|nr:hypothetical protein [Pseudomonas putida]MDD1965618.1 hypothetical protein [Pseudomonas putida]
MIDHGSGEKGGDSMWPLSTIGNVRIMTSRHFPDDWSNPSYKSSINPVAVRLAGVGIFDGTAAGKPDCYGCLHED